MLNKQLREDILEEITPDNLERETHQKIVKKVLNKIKRVAKQKGVQIECFIGGSFGKGTYLKGNFDVDVFIRFDMELNQDQTISQETRNLLDECGFDYEIFKGSRDYYGYVIKSKGVIVTFEFVPTLSISTIDDAKNTTDISFMHVEFVRDHIKNNPHLEEEIRLTKRFFKVHGLYGAESYIGGFSGHVLEILVLHFGSLEKLLTQARTWGEQTFIDSMGHYKDENEILVSLNSDKVSPLIVIDPILKDRNASRGVSQTLYSQFVTLARSLLELTRDDFTMPIINAKEEKINAKKFAKENGLTLIIVSFSFSTISSSEDIVGSKLKRLFKKVSSYYCSYDFHLFKEEFFISMNENQCFYSFYFEKGSLPKLKKVIGPKVSMKDSFNAFIEHHPNYFIEEDKVCAYDVRSVYSLKEVPVMDTNDMQVLLGKKLGFVKKLTTSIY